MMDRLLAEEETIDDGVRAELWCARARMQKRLKDDPDPFDDLREVLRRWEIGLTAATEPLRLAKLALDAERAQAA